MHRTATGFLVTKGMMFSALFCVSTAVLATDRQVTNEADDGSAGTLRSVIAASATGDTIYIPGGYFITVFNQLDLSDKALRIVGQGDGATICGSGTNRLLYGASNAYNRPVRPIYIENVTMTNGIAPSGGGGGVFKHGTTKSPVSVVLNNCRIVGNYSDYYGGVFFNTGCVLAMTNCYVYGNKAALGGGVFGVNGYLTSSAINASNCWFEANSVTNGSGGVFRCTASMDFVDCMITNNTASSSAGFLSVNQTSGSNARTFRNCTFANNDGGGDSGVGYFNSCVSYSFDTCVFRQNKADNGSIGTAFGKVDFTGCLFEENFARTIPGYWFSAGMFKTQVTSSQPIYYCLSNCVVRGNTSAGANAVLWIYNAGTNSSFKAFNTTFEGNIASSGNAIGSLSVASAIVNCTFEGNQALNGSAGALEIGTARNVGITNCTFYGNAASSTAGAIYISSASAQPTIVNCTIVSNRSNTAAVYVKELSANVTMINTVVAENYRLNDTLDDIYGVFSNMQCCAFSEDVGAYVEGSNWFGRSYSTMKLEPPADNDSTMSYSDGSYLQTMAIGRHSILRDAGLSVPGLVFDARGAVRDITPDIGAYEYINMLFPSTLIVR